MNLLHTNINNKDNLSESLNFTESKYSHIPISPRNRKHRVVVRKVNSSYLSRQVVNGAERLIIVALVEELHLV